MSYVVVTWTHRRQILDLVLRHRLPAIYSHRTCPSTASLLARADQVIE